MKDFSADIYTELFPYILRFLAIPIFIATLFYGLVTQDAHKAGEFYMKIVTIISAPVAYSLTAPLRDLSEKIQQQNAPKP
jgi:hypothetical protein